jgi:hypothetical protein
MLVAALVMAGEVAFGCGLMLAGRVHVEGMLCTAALVAGVAHELRLVLLNDDGVRGMRRTVASGRGRAMDLLCLMRLIGVGESRNTRGVLTSNARVSTSA